MMTEANVGLEDSLVGVALPGGLTVMEPLATGSTGTVYRAEQRALGRTVAVKFINQGHIGDAAVEGRFITEARASSQLNHPNSVNVIAFGTMETRLYLVMEFVRGRDIGTVLADEGPFAARRAASVLQQVLMALDEAHTLDIVHRNLKPNNIVVQSLRSGEDFVKVLDFGLAKVREELKAGTPTAPGEILGTPRYMAPEQAFGTPIDARADLYACGVILFELLTGQLPFTAANDAAMVMQHALEPPPDPRELAPNGVPEPLAEIVLKALEKQPPDRFQTALEFAEALRQALGSLPPAARRRQCTQCGANAGPAQKYCFDCGAPIGDADDEPPEAAPSAPEGESSLVGRDDDLAWLRAARAGIETSICARTVCGTPGVGKSRLLQEFRDELTRNGDFVVATNTDGCWPDWCCSALRLTIEALVQRDPSKWTGSILPDAEPAARMGLSAIYESSPAWTDGLAAWATAPPLTEPWGKHRIWAAAALRAALEHALQRAEGRPVVVLLDDLDAMDGAGRHAFADVLAEPPAGPLLIVATHRQDWDPEWPGSEQRRLLPLTVSQAETLLHAAGQSPQASQLTGPTLPMVLEQSAFYSADGGAAPPTGLADLIAARIDRLSTNMRRVLQALAVVGNQATATRVQEMLPELDLEEYLDGLDRGGWLRRDDDAVSLAHPMLRDVTLAGVPAEVRRRLHILASDTSTDEPLCARAWHAAHAERTFEALMLLEQLAADTICWGDLEGGSRALRLGMDLARREMLSGGLDDPVAAFLLFSYKLGDTLSLGGQLLDAAGVLGEALDLTGPREPMRARLLASLAYTTYRQGKREQADATLTQASELATEIERQDLVAAYQQLRNSWDND